MRRIDISDKVFGRLEVISFDSYRGSARHAYWLCKCSCGKEVIVRGSHLRSGNTKSCGCFSTEKGKDFLLKYANSDKHKGNGNPMWKGDDAKHSAIHTWLNTYYKKEWCEYCKSKKNLDFAKIKGKRHSHNIDNYMILCRKCHIEYDKEK